MEKSLAVASFLMWSLLGCAQPDYDTRLRELYRNTVPTIEADSVNRLLTEKRPLILLDTREKTEYLVSHVPQALCVGYEDFDLKRVAHLPKSALVVVYCSVGYRSERVGEQLQKAGFTNVRNLYGGIFQWKNEGYEVVNRKQLATDSVHTYNKSWSRWLTRGVKVY
jgi:rhodanese-related sulfurtransferase